VETWELERIERIIRLIEIALVIGKNLALIMAVFVGVTFALAAYNAAVANIVGSIVSLAFGVAGLVFFAQVRQTRKRHYRRRTTFKTGQQKYHRAAAA
jgi:4-hydroxybenzoate polyprenyltransferase